MGLTTARSVSFQKAEALVTRMQQELRDSDGISPKTQVDFKAAVGGLSREEAWDLNQLLLSRVGEDQKDAKGFGRTTWTALQDRANQADMGWRALPQGAHPRLAAFDRA